MTQTPKKPIAGIWVILLDILLGAALLLSFCFFHHVLPRMNPDPVGTVGSGFTKADDPFTKPNAEYTGILTAPSIPRTDPVTGSVTSGGTSTIPTLPKWDTSGDFGAKFAPLFAQDDQIYYDDTTYQSHDVYMKLTSYDTTIKQKTSKGGKEVNTHVVYHVMDVYVRNIENLYCSYVESGTTSLNKLTSDTTFGQTFAAISGDLFSIYSSKRVIVRNGKVIRTSDYLTEDICVLYFDGTMETITPDEYNWSEIAAKNPYQIWSFGPELMDEDGNAKTDISSSVWRTNPRSAIGYVEPGHYVLVAVSGYRDSAQKETNGVGMTLDTLAKVMEEYGCVSAYNLDGGASVYGYWNQKTLVQVSNSNGSHRSISDIICIGERGG